MRIQLQSTPYSVCLWSNSNKIHPNLPHLPSWITFYLLHEAFCIMHFPYSPLLLFCGNDDWIYRGSPGVCVLLLHRYPHNKKGITNCIQSTYRVQQIKREGGRDWGVTEYIQIAFHGCSVPAWLKLLTCCWLCSIHDS